MRMNEPRYPDEAAERETLLRPRFYLWAASSHLSHSISRAHSTAYFINIAYIFLCLQHSFLFFEFLTGMPPMMGNWFRRGVSSRRQGDGRNERSSRGWENDVRQRGLREAAFLPRVRTPNFRFRKVSFSRLARPAGQAGSRVIRRRICSCIPHFLSLGFMRQPIS